MLLSQRFIKPYLISEAHQLGVSVSQTIATELLNKKYFFKQNAEVLIEERLREFSYLYPNIRRIEVYQKKNNSTTQTLLASTVEEESGLTVPEIQLVTDLTSHYHSDDGNDGEGWEILTPLYSYKRENILTLKENQILGTVRIFFSTKLVRQLARSLSTLFIFVGSIGGVLLFLILNTVLRRTISTDQKLKEVEMKNLKLSEQLHEVERNLLNLEKFSALGQLTASFAHEIGTPLNAIGGHLSLLKNEILKISDVKPKSKERVEILEGQVLKISSIVRSFLQNTSKPMTQSQLLDPHLALEKCLQVLTPRFELNRISIQKNFNRTLGPLRVAPIDFEQVTMNLLNNAIDSLRVRSLSDNRKIKVSTNMVRIQLSEYCSIKIEDTGVGIAKEDLQKVLKPFFTTKPPGEGTGLGLSICQDILRKYKGELKIQSEKNQWTEVEILIPFYQEG